MTTRFLTLLTLALAVPAGAQAGTIRVSYADATGLTIAPQITQRNPPPGALDDGVSLSRGLSGNSELYRVSGLQDIATSVVAGPGCAISNGTANCAISGSLVVTATLGAGNDRLHTHSNQSRSVGDMFVNGGTGDDIIDGALGPDSLDGGSGNDHIEGKGGGDVVHGGSGDDSFDGDLPIPAFVGPNAVPGTNTILGEDGNDRFVARGDARTADLFNGGNGIDEASYSIRTEAVHLTVRASGSGTANDGRSGEGDGLDDVETMIGGRGNDEIELTGTGQLEPPGGFTLRGERGDDTLTVTQRVFTTLDGGLGADIVTGGNAGDTIFAREGTKDTIACNAGLDSVVADLRDAENNAIPPDCESVDTSDRREGPNVRVRSRRLLVERDGSISVRLACPRSLRRGCNGSLAVRLDEDGTSFGSTTRYAVERGESESISIRVPAAQRADARRRGARLRVQSIERGVHGPKTTLRSLPSRAAPGRAAGSTTEPAGSSREVTGVFVGRVTPRTVIGIVLSEGGVTAYLCNGSTLGRWYKADERRGNHLRLGSRAERLVIRAARRGVEGTVRIGRRVVEFSAARARGRAGLYRFEGEIDGASHLAGWVRLNSGRTVGALSVGSNLSLAPSLSLNAQTTSIGGRIVGVGRIFGVGLPEAMVFDRVGGGVALDDQTTTSLASDGPAQEVQWTRAGSNALADDAFLAIDATAIRSHDYELRRPGGELLDGVHLVRGTRKVKEVLTRTSSTTTTALDGWHLLRTLDRNRDGRLDAADPAWDALRTFKDTDGDGAMDSSEVSLGPPPPSVMLRIDLTGLSAPATDSQGNVRVTGTYRPEVSGVGPEPPRPGNPRAVVDALLATP